ncbi:hypothetical protein RHGRI_010628 [Rhododendron griersonianum]|uniref:Pentatricopeptide repeat-containing protein n=1 Tax=Rhododendron griersonianum TaxID=479676 RepID=A0AAV6KJW6_9ERIC|nr:hypothetical protein RHGRI_010628 [Rhododendron griersonianum]
MSEEDLHTCLLLLHFLHLHLNRGLSIRTSRACCVKSEVPSCYLDDKASNGDSCPAISEGYMSLKRFYRASHGSPRPFVGRCSFSSQADSESSTQEEDDLEDGFSELETPANADVVKEKHVDEVNEDELISEPELSEDEDDAEGPQNELELSDIEADIAEKRSAQMGASSALFDAIMRAPGLSVQSALDNWVEGGNELTRSEISLAMLNLRKRKMYGRALQLSEWLESMKRLDFTERDYASRVDLIAKVRGLPKAESYIDKIPKSFRGEVVYRTLLANCVSANNVKKAEEVFNKMKDLEFPITCFACNQLLLLYKRLDKKKIADVLLLMEKENVKPSRFTYRLLIDTKGQSNDIHGMDQIVETMKAEGIELDINTLSVLAKHYVFGGLKEKAESILKEMEGGNIKKNRRACRTLLPLYAAMGKGDEVERVWKACESNPRIDECLAAIEAWGKLNRIVEAEAVFGRMQNTWKKLNAKHYSMLLKVYANHKMLTKGKDLVKQMADSGCRIGPFTWDAVVKLYVGAGEVEKADSILHKATQQNRLKPMFSSYMTIMDQYSRRGDIRNSEKMFHRMRQDGYMGRIRQFQSLIQAYVVAKAPAYGMRERMKADNIFPNKAVADQLVSVDAFRKSAVSDLLD